ncbi:patatin-like phospholipase family protein [Fonticella tunisiensis]|uniref:NTE family protein n=1 Tax=Fonticella tunisiensis TaxID=1096341 RepID=A0A4R7KP94_9CLOT|nr:patatin-like phospholipase family protein [Fonticella tunisiensis]TDT60931.1 NTE family protein [Fonticella tunisiensis]
MKVNAVFEGGGVKGIGLVGAVCCLEDNGFTWNCFAGTSAGATIAALLAAGYSGNEIKNILMSLDYRKFQDRDGLQSLPLIGKSLGFLLEKGLYSGDFFEKWLQKLLDAKGKTKFKHIMFKNKSLLKIIASDITRKKMLVIPDDLKDYGINGGEFPIARAVRMSTAIPFYFKPIKLRYKYGTSYIVDGGILSLYPIWIFDEGKTVSMPTLGFKLVEPDTSFTSLGKTDVISYGLDIISTMIEKDDERYIRKRDFIRTIPIPTMGIKTTEFDITKERSRILFNSGYRSAEKFLKKWYVEK